MTSALRTFNKLGPRLKALYVTSLVLSVALMVFGAVLLSSAGGIVTLGYSVTGGGDQSIGSSSDDDDGISMVDGDDNYDTTPFPTASPSLDSTPLPTMVPSSNYYLRPVDKMQPSTKQPSTKQPSTPPSLIASQDPSFSPIIKHSSNPSTKRPSTKQPSTKQPSTKQPSTPPSLIASQDPSFSPVIEHSSNPSTKRPSIERPLTKQPSTKQPSTKQPSTPPSLITSQDPSFSPTIEHSSIPFVHTSESPSASPSANPTDLPTSSLPSQSPISLPSTEPTHPPSSSILPTSSYMPSTSNAPTLGPLFPTHAEPTNPNSTYYNYNATKGAQYGPSVWDHVMVLNSTEHNYWHEFGFVENQCNKEKVAQSPIDVCTKPEKHCQEYHEFRSKRGDFKISGEFMMKQILSNKLRVLMTRRLGEEPDPPHVDFAGVGASNLDLLNIDIKFPSEHTVCGRRFDGEMQYYFFHPGKKSLLVVTWLLEAKVGNPVNEQMQFLTNEFQEIYDGNEEVCIQKSLQESSLSETSSVTRVGTNNNASNYTMLEEEPIRRKLAKNDQKKSGGGIWDPFHQDIQKTIHFWGYTGSLTEPPCTGNTLWRIMDVPVQITVEQLNQMQNILFNNRDNQTCAYTSTHYKGSVARPIADDGTVRYYKCTRSDYVSDDEREQCGDGGCVNNPFGSGLDPYVDPIVHVTGPPSESPTMMPTQSVSVL